MSSLGLKNSIYTFFSDLLSIYFDNAVDWVWVNARYTENPAAGG